MTRRIYKVFFNALSGQEAWLNAQCSSGWRLVGAKGWKYEFEPCTPGQYCYRVEFVADYSLQQLKEYTNLLDELDIRHFSKAANVGKVSFGSARLRALGRNSAIIATSPGIVNHELLILEKEQDGKPFEVHSDLESKLNYLRKIRNTYCISTALLLIIAVTGTAKLTFMGQDYSYILYPFQIVFKSIAVAFGFFTGYKAMSTARIIGLLRTKQRLHE